jgi:hypothetical protein
MISRFYPTITDCVAHSDRLYAVGAGGAAAVRISYVMEQVWDVVHGMSKACPKQLAKAVGNVLTVVVHHPVSLNTGISDVTSGMYKSQIHVIETEPGRRCSSSDSRVVHVLRRTTASLAAAAHAGTTHCVTVQPSSNLHCRGHICQTACQAAGSIGL